MKLFFILLFSLCIKANRAFSLSYPAFYEENGQLMEMRQPPFFNYNYDYCEEHTLNGPPGHGYSVLCDYIFHTAYFSLINAIEVGKEHRLFPPPYYWDYLEKNLNYFSKITGWACHFFKRYSLDFKPPYKWARSDYTTYTEYTIKFDFLFYWLNLCYDLVHKRLEKEIEKKNGELEKAIKDNWRQNYLDEIVEEITKLKEKKERVEPCRVQSLEILNKSLEEITDIFFVAYTHCFNSHMHLTALYERGKIYFDRGEIVEFISDIGKLINLGHKADLKYAFELGKAYNDINQYNQAIIVLSEFIQKDPNHKEAYFERAIAYFETGNFKLALADYVKSDFKQTYLDPSNKKHFQHIRFAQGIVEGCLKGGADGAIEFVPSLLATTYGLGKGLWRFATNAVGVTKELVESSIALCEFVKDNASIELLAQVVPELKECIENWTQLDDIKRGDYIGYIISRYGVDALAWGGCARALKLYRDLKRANAALTLESAKLSQKNLEEIAVASEKFFQSRAEYKKNCKLHFGQQEKHIPGANNFQIGKSELTISIANLEKLGRQRLGEGVPSRFSFGEAGYREIIDFGEEIGIHVDKDSKIRTKTRIGEIHYDKNGQYHVVPVHPCRYIIKE